MAKEALRSLHVLKDGPNVVAGSRPHHFYDAWPVSPYTPVAELFVRENEVRKEIPRRDYRLIVGGANGRGAITMPLATLMTLGEPVEQPMVLQCAGDNRNRLQATTWVGEPWGAEAYGAVLMKGVSLSTVLGEDGIKGKYVVFTGADDYQRRLTAQQVQEDPRLMLAWEMNGEPLTSLHGGPVKLVAPGWYGMQHVKNLARISFTNEPGELKYNDTKYMFSVNGGSRPVTEMKVNSRILASDGDKVRRGLQVMKGVAWAGSLPYMHGGEENLVEGVEVSLDGGKSWSTARFLDNQPVPNMWRRWEYDLDVSSGPLVVMSRAIDTRGNVQPMEGIPNPNGYENNSSVPVILIGV